MYYARVLPEEILDYLVYKFKTVSKKEVSQINAQVSCCRSQCNIVASCSSLTKSRLGVRICIKMQAFLVQRDVI